MATELSIVISASAMIGGAMSAIRTLTGDWTAFAVAQISGVMNKDGLEAR